MDGYILYTIKIGRETMEENFKALGCKAWGVTEDYLIYGNKNIPYSDLEFFKLISTPTTPLTNGVVQCGYNGKILTCAFRHCEKESVHKIISFVTEKIEVAHGIVKDYKYKFTSHTGSVLEVYEDHIIIYHMQVGSLLTNIARGGTLAGKRIDYSDMTSVQFREPAGITVGFIQFAYAGCLESKGGLMDMMNDENSVPIHPSLIDQAKEIYDYIEKRRKEIKSAPAQAVVQQVSVADEIKKFKELLDMDIITQDEFDAKKKQLLNL